MQQYYNTQQLQTTNNTYAVLLHANNTNKTIKLNCNLCAKQTFMNTIQPANYYVSVVGQKQSAKKSVVFVSDHI